MSQTEVQNVINEKSTKFGKQIAILVKKAQPNPTQEITCPNCWFGFLPSEANIESMDLDKIASEIAASIKNHMQRIVDMAIIERSNGTDLNNAQMIAALEKQRDTANQSAENIASHIDNVTSMIAALTFIANEISKTKQRTATTIQNRSPIEEIIITQGNTLDLILVKIDSVLPKSTQP